VCICKLLLQHGAMPTSVDTGGSTPAHIAGVSGHFADEALLSKAADLYSKAHANDAAAVGAANSVSSSEQLQRGVTHDISSRGSSSSSGQEVSKGATNESSSG
jgi:ankyrin repeat protein